MSEETNNYNLYYYKAFVKSAYDGDSITVDISLGFGVELKDQKIRLLGINTPEIRGSEREKGLISRDALRQKILNKWVIIKTYKDKKGKFGRWLAEIWLDNECINDWLLKEGLAKKYS